MCSVTLNTYLVVLYTREMATTLGKSFILFLLMTLATACRARTPLVATRAEPHLLAACGQALETRLGRQGLALTEPAFQRSDRGHLVTGFFSSDRRYVECLVTDGTLEAVGLSVVQW